MKRRGEEVMTGNLTAMIDVVFQLIIFFVCTTNLQDSAVNPEIGLPPGPHGAEMRGKDPRQIAVDVDKKGHILIGRAPVNERLLLGILKKAVAEFGQDVPVLIRADGEVRHTFVKKVMDACSVAGISRIQFIAVREQTKKPKKK